MRRSAHPSQTAAADGIAAVRAPPLTAQPMTREFVPHSSPALAAASHDAAANVAMSSITADAVLQPPPAATAAPATSLVREMAPATAGVPAPPVAAQVAPAMISLANRTDGSNEIRISLHPLDLGQVEIRLVRGRDGSTSVTVAADRPQTLQELAQNAHHLHVALDAASVPTIGRSLDFVAASGSVSDRSQNDMGGQTSAAGQHLGDASGDRGPGQERARLQDRHLGSGTDGKEDAGIGAPPARSSGRRWQYNGLNITA